nr:hypothetical protein [candidate division Zixibacteria bacterium]
MKLSLFKVVILLSLILATTAFGQQQGLTFNFFGGGARSEGMGQAFTAVSDDATAARWNPAGLYVHEKTLMVFSYASLMPRGEYSFYPYNSGSRVDVFDHSGNFGSLSNWSIVTPLRVKGHHVVASVGYNDDFDVYYKFGENLFGDWTGENPNALFEKHGRISSLNLGMGTRIYQNISIGATGNIYTGKVVTNEGRYYYRDVDYNNGYATYASNVTVLDSTSFSGFNTTLGILYSGDNFRAGFTVKTPFNLDGESDTSQYRISTRNGVGIIQDDWNITGFGIFKTDTIYVDNRTFKIEMPLMMTMGMAMNTDIKLLGNLLGVQDESLLLSADVEYRKFSDRMIKNLVNFVINANGDRIETYEIRDPNWSDVWQVRLGAEYLFNTGFGEIPIRLGYRNESYPQGDIASYSVEYVNERDQVGDTTNTLKVFYVFDYDKGNTTGYSLSFGTGIHWSRILLDFAYTYTTYNQMIYVSDNVLRSENDWKNHHLNFSFTGYF